MKKSLYALLLGAAIAHAQIPGPQINLTGNIGCQGFPCLNSGTLVFASDANHTMTVAESSAAGGIKLTSAGELTATRSLILPTAFGRLQFMSIQNATTGGQSITVIGQSGTGITIPNGQSATGVWFDGTNVTGALASGGGGGGISGQTPNFAPLATTSTTSTTSSHFFDDPGGFSGVAQGQLMTGTTPNCKLNGVTFLKWGCNNVNTFDDGTQDASFNNSLTGTTMTMQAWGSAGAGNAEGRATIMFGDSNNGAMVTPGAKFGWTTNTNYFGIGDVLGFKNVHECHAGMAYASDQGCQLNYEKWTDLGFYHATILTGGTNTHPLLNGTGGCTNVENQACAPTNGWIVTDTTTAIATGHITAAPAEGSPVSWTSTATTDMTLPTPTAWGTAIGANIVAGGEWKSPTAQTIVIGSGGGTGSGSFTAGDLACVIGDKFHEQEIITAVSGSAGAQTITIPLSRPETSVLVVKGQCLYVMSTANDAHGMTYVLPATSTDGSHIIISRVGFSGVGPWEGGFPGAEWWTTGTGANAAVNVYAGARILWVGTSVPGFFPFNGSNILVQLEPNTFSVGDALVSSDYPLQKFDGRETNLDMQMPATSAGGETFERIRMTGPGMSANSTVFSIANEQDASTYTPNGGPLTEPNVTVTAGYFDKFFESGYAPLTAGFQINSHQPGQTNYQIWSDPWGTLRLDNTNTFHFDNSNITLNTGSVTAAGGFFSYGVRAGSGDGAGNGAGVDFTWGGTKTVPDTWLAQCDFTSDGGKTDLCVTSQGASRTSSVVTADRGLQLRHLTMSPVTGNTNGTITFNDNFGADAIDLFDSGTGNKYGWGLNGGEMQFFVQDATETHFSFNGAANGLQPTGTNEFARLTPRVSGGGWTLSSGEGYCFSDATSNAVTADSCIWKLAAGSFSFGNGTAGDFSGTLKANTVIASTFETGTGSPQAYITSPSSGVIDVGVTSGASDATVNAGDANFGGSGVCTAGNGRCTGGTFPVYNASGTAQTGAHVVIGRVAVAGASVTVTLTGSAVFTSSTSYDCQIGASSLTAGSTATSPVTYTDGSHFNILADYGAGMNGTATYTCTGN